MDDPDAGDQRWCCQADHDILSREPKRSPCGEDIEDEIAESPMKNCPLSESGGPDTVYPDMGVAGFFVRIRLCHIALACDHGNRITAEGSIFR